MSRLALILGVCFWLAFGAAGGLHAQARDATAQRLDSAAAGLAQIELGLTRNDLSANELQQLRAQLEPIATSIQAVLDETAPKLNAAKARLDQLGAQPKDKEAEAAAVAETRKEQQKTFDDIDASYRRAHLLALQATQLTATVGARRRILFTRSLFERSSSILSPALWVQVIDELPRDIRAIGILTSDWLTGVLARIDAYELGTLALAFAVVAGLCFPLSRMARRLMLREADIADPSRLQKVMAAVRVAVLAAAVPIVAVLTLAYVFDAFELFNGRLQPLVWTVVDGVKRVAIAIGLTSGMLAPGRPKWRLIRVGERAAERIARLVAAIALIVSVFKTIEAMNDVIAATLATSVAARAVGALLVATAIAIALATVPSRREAEEGVVPPATGQRAWYGPIRVIAWVLVVTIATSVLVGYVALGAFLVDQIVWVSSVGAVLYLLTVLADDGVDCVLQPTAPLGRNLVAALGIRRESLAQVSVLLSGAAHVALVVSAGLLVLVPWGLQSEDLLGYVQAAFFGFTVGDVRISLSTIVVALLLFLFAILATKGVQGWLDAKYMPRTRLDPGLRNSIRTSIGYLGFVVAVAVALSYLGLSFEKFAFVAGALSVGIGFGLQSIVSNFVSGLILLWERAIRVGDWIVAGQDEGYVRRINVRSTEIETFERATVIVPNSNLVSGVVKNWVRSDRVGRVRIALGVAYEADPEKVREVLITCARASELVLKIPAPAVLFTNFGESAIDFELICFVDDVETAGRIKSDLNFAIFRGLQQAGIAIAAPRRDLRIRDLDRLEALLPARPAADGTAA